MMTGSFHILLFNGTFHVDKMHVWFKIANQGGKRPGGSTFLSLFLSHQWHIFKSLLDALDPKCNTFMSVVMMLE